VINDLKEDSDKLMNEVRKSIQDLDKKISNMEEKFSKEMEITKTSTNVRNGNLNKSNTNHSGQYYQQTRSSRRKNIRDGGQDGRDIARKQSQRKNNTTYKNFGL
jgi:hypothetical protein